MGCGDASLVGPIGDGGRLDALMLDRPTEDQVCAIGQRTCDGRCVDPSGAHCGACVNACAAGQHCVAGTCVLSCPGVEAMCAGECRNLLTDTASCGACGRACPSGQVCSLGRCATTCAATLTTCTASGGATACVDVRTDLRHCGRCGNACATGQTCVDGACALACPGAQRDCGGTCRDVQGDNVHCGACDRACALPHTQTQGCTRGTCAVVRCAGGYGDCDGDAANGCETSSSVMHCGGCGLACQLPHASATCAAGGCAVRACDPGFDWLGADPDLRDLMRFEFLAEPPYRPALRGAAAPRSGGA